MISHSHKLLFIHIPKCGGTSVEHLFLGDDMDNIDPGQKHYTLQQYHDEYGSMIDDYTQFTIVRNPYDRFISHYFYRVADNTQHGYEPNKSSLTPVEFLSTSGRYITTNQLSYITLGGHVPDSMNVIRFENIDLEYSQFCKHNNIAHNTLPHYNKTTHDHYSKYYDDDLKRLVAERYSNDLTYFEYNYEDRK